MLFVDCLTVKLAQGMSVDETKTICTLHIEFVKQRDKIYAQYEEILNKMSDTQAVLKRMLTQKYQKLVNDNTLQKAVVKYSKLLDALSQYQVTEMDGHHTKRKKLKKDKERVKALKAQKQKEKDKDQSMQT